MRRPYAVTHEKPTISPTFESPRVYLDEGSPLVWKLYHCHVCGKPVFEYQTKVKIIMAGDNGKEVQALARIQCKLCKTMYIIS
jgi:DNA-directed RNA polymerase subunit RPC12/RpoP